MEFVHTEDLHILQTRQQTWYTVLLGKFDHDRNPQIFFFWREPSPLMAQPFRLVKYDNLPRSYGHSICVCINKYLYVYVIIYPMEVPMICQFSLVFIYFPIFPIYFPDNSYGFPMDSSPRPGRLYIWRWKPVMREPWCRIPLGDTDALDAAVRGPQRSGFCGLEKDHV